jgi:hypothetical protein
VLQEYTTEKQRSFMRFLWAKGLNTKYFYKEMFLVYGGKCLSRKRFTTGLRNVTVVSLMTKRLKRSYGSGCAGLDELVKR